MIAPAGCPIAFVWKAYNLHCSFCRIVMTGRQYTISAQGEEIQSPNTEEVVIVTAARL